MPTKRISIGCSLRHSAALRSSCSGRRHSGRGVAGNVFGLGHVGHRVAVFRSVFDHVERRGHVEDRPAVLDRDDAPRHEAAPVANAIDVEDDRRLGVAGTQEVGVERVHGYLRVDRPAGGDERLREHLPTEHARPTLFEAHAAEQVHLEAFEVEHVDKIVQGSTHKSATRRLASGASEPAHMRRRAERASRVARQERTTANGVPRLAVSDE